MRMATVANLAAMVIEAIVYFTVRDDSYSWILLVALGAGIVGTAGMLGYGSFQRGGKGD